MMGLGLQTQAIEWDLADIPRPVFAIRTVLFGTCESVSS
jgi:hypothetical protein